MIKKFCFFISLFLILHISNVSANTLSSCTNNLDRDYIIDFSDEYYSLGNDSNLKSFYTDFIDYFNSQNNYDSYYFTKVFLDNNVYNYQILLYNKSDLVNLFYYLQYPTSNYLYNNVSVSISNSANVSSYNENYSLSFDSNNFVSSNFNQSSLYLSAYSNYISYINYQNYFTNGDTTNFYYVYTNSQSKGFIIIDSSDDIQIKHYTSNSIISKINDDYYCLTGDILPSVNDIYPLYSSTPTPTPTNTDNIYLPIKDFSDYDTYIYLDNNIIRAIKDNTCTDFNISNHYNKIISSCENFDYSNYVVINQQNLTNDFLYRLDISSFIILLLFMFLIVVFIPYYVFSSFFRKRRF